jgi:CO/xanthine dehydrogenase Mo-binding subunit
MGQGVASTLSLIAAEVLGVPITRIKFFDVHTGRVPDSGPTVSSRSTIMGGQAVKRAAEAVRAVLVRVAAKMLAVPEDQLQLRQDRIGCTVAGDELDPARSLPFREVAARTFDEGLPLLGFGWYRAPHTSWDPQRGGGDAYFTFVYGANVAEVEVDTATGKVDVVRVWAIHDVGRAISPAMLRNQVYGGVVMGLGYGLLEQYVQREGIPTAHNFDEYLIPTAMDLPAIDVTIVENPDPAGPFGAKSIGEPATEIAAPAILNAIAHATGRRITTLPADLETVYLGRTLQPPTRRTRESCAPNTTEGRQCAG